MPGPGGDRGALGSGWGQPAWLGTVVRLEGHVAL